MFETFTVAQELQSELARLRDDGRDRALHELVDLVGACQSLINQAAAVQTLAMALVAAIEDVALEDGTVVEQHRGLGHQRLDAPALVSDQLGVSDAVGSSRVGAAVDVVTRLPGLLAAMGDGRLDEYRARIVSDELREAPAEVCAQVVARVADSLGTEPPALLRRRVRRALGAVDADLLRAKADRARSERSLCRWPGDEPGVDTWMGSFPAEQSRSGWAVVDGLARQYLREGKSGGLEQARADALMDLIHARATGTFVVQVAVPADQLNAMTRPAPAPTQPGQTRREHALPASGRASTDETTHSVSAGALDNDELVTVAGLGMPGTTEVRRTWFRTLTRSGESDLDATTQAATATRWEVVACHTDTGALLSVSSDQSGAPGLSGRGRATDSEAYRPPPALIDLVKARDGRCRFPGCTVNARFCDLDHVRPWPLGPTHATNLICLCRRHHRIKQTIRWQVRIDPDATVRWTDPTGRLRTTLPLDFLQRDTRHDSAPSDPAHTGGANSTTLGRGAAAAIDEPPVVAPPEPFHTAPLDTPEVRWSAWEEELAHELTRAERLRVRHPVSRRASEEPLGRHELTAELSSCRDDLTIDPAFGDPCRARRRRRTTRATDEPPF